MASEFDTVLRVVAERFDVSIADIRSQRRSRHVVPARLIAAYLAHEVSGMTAHEIGDRLGGRDHTNIVVYCRAVARKAAEDESYRRLVQELKGLIRRRAELP